MSAFQLLRWIVRQAICRHRHWCDVVRGDGASYRVCSDCGKTL